MYQWDTMKVQRISYVVLILSTLFRYHVSYTIEASHYKGDGSRSKFGSIATGDVFINESKSQFVRNDYLVNTPGCYIPDYSIHYKYTHSLYKHTNDDAPCGLKAVSLFNLGNNKITFGVNETAMKIYSNNKKYSCCYMYAYKTAVFPGSGTKTQLVYTKCVPFRNGTTTTLLYEIIKVTCKQKNEIYNDAFISVRKLAANSVKLDGTWNVLMLGISSMSRARLFGTMPKTTEYLRSHKWLDYRGYTKNGADTLHNLMSLLTGMNSSRIYEKCGSGLFKCKDDFIWNKFHEAGYKTAYGEDYLELPDTFSRYKGLSQKPTDHYMRPFYLIGERRDLDVICTRTKPSATHLLSYANNFVKSYKNNLFFGLFWINSYSYGPTDNPYKLDNEMANWLQKLQNQDILKRTIVIFFSDNGLRYGEMKLPIQSYYDERLPMLFVWAPQSFQKKYPQMYTNMNLNQHRLISPFDLYVTLGDILKLTKRSSTGAVSESCPQCTGLFTLNSLFRTCADAGINQNWCVCHKMTTVKKNAAESVNSIMVAVKYINKLVKNIKPIMCYKCRPLTLHSILRSHAFQSGIKTYNVVAFQMSHDVIFEATIAYRRNTSKVTALQSLTSNNRKGTCVWNINERPYCHCSLSCKTLIV